MIEPSPITLKQAISELETTLAQDHVDPKCLNILARHVFIYTGDQAQRKELVEETIIPLLQRAETRISQPYQTAMIARIRDLKKDYDIAA
jgi:HD-GYP domain-containing protein (c-di-GMP phosphodiesterase class II)